MASVRSLDGIIDLAHGSAQGSTFGRGFLAGVATYWSAIRDGGAAAHEYNRLVRNGTPHDEAVARVFEDHFGRR